MKMDLKHSVICLAALSLALSGCSINPFRSNNHLTGSATSTVIGAAASAGAVAALGGSKPLILAAGLGGGALGYYLSTLRHDAGELIQAGGQVYQVGYYVGIDLPTDQIFEVNTAEFTPQAPAILDSVTAVLQRYPDNNILISGNTSGFGLTRYEKKLSLARAKQVTSYLKESGINHFKEDSMNTRKLSYVGYGNYFPISSDLTNQGIRQNSRIQITLYPSNADLHLDQRHQALHNIGSLKDDVGTVKSSNECRKYDYQNECW
jgi:outer membrane protein OmpA-like peptidoglycan-associated protein